MPTSEQDRQQIAALIEQYQLGFATLDAGMLKSIWDQDDDNIIYLAQEAAQPVYGWTGVAQYYDSVVQSLENVRTMELSNVSINVLDDTAYVYLHFRFEGEMQGTLHDADGRVTFLLHRKNGAWKAIHYHESSPPF